jgi:tetratricopeptide (TPR) repeat protein
MKQLLRRCFKEREYERWDNFGEIEVHLLDIYKFIIGHSYPRSSTKSLVKTADILNNEALSYIEMGLHEQAEAIWKEALNKQPDHIDSIFNLTVFRWRNAHLDDMTVANTFRILYENNPGNHKALRLYVNICMERRDYYIVLKLLYIHKELPVPDVDNMQRIKWSMSPVSSDEVLEEQEKKFKSTVNKIKEYLCSNDIENAIKLLELLYQLPPVHRPSRQKVNDEIGKHCRIKGVLSLFVERNMGCAAHYYTFSNEGFIISNQRLYDVINQKYHRKLEDALSVYAFGTDSGTVYGVPAGQESRYLIKAYDVETGKCLFTFQGEHQKPVNVLTVSPDGKYLLSASNDCTVRLWNIGRRKNIRVFTHTGEVKNVFFGADTQSFLSLSTVPGKEQNEIFLWNTNPESMQIIKNGVTNICLSRERTQLLVCSPEGIEVIALPSL